MVGQFLSVLLAVTISLWYTLCMEKLVKLVVVLLVVKFLFFLLVGLLT